MEVMWSNRIFSVTAYSHNKKEDFKANPEYIGTYNLRGAPEIQSKVQVLVVRNLDFASHDGRARARCPTFE